jgi:hypothetical protein
MLERDAVGRIALARRLDRHVPVVGMDIGLHLAGIEVEVAVDPVELARAS